MIRPLLRLGRKGVRRIRRINLDNRRDRLQVLRLRCSQGSGESLAQKFDRSTSVSEEPTTAKASAVVLRCAWQDGLGQWAR
jgi:hypothetical protein